MNKLSLGIITIGVLFASLNNTYADTKHPSVISKQEIASDISKHPRMTTEKLEDGGTALDVFSMLSSDKKFIVGKYKSEATREVITEPYGVDEYMHFLEGGVTLTSSDGKVTEIKAGDSVSISKEWTGIWETKGYTKIYVIYSPEPME